MSKLIKLSKRLIRTVDDGDGQSHQESYEVHFDGSKEIFKVKIPLTVGRTSVSITLSLSHVILMISSFFLLPALVGKNSGSL